MRYCKKCGVLYSGLLPQCPKCNPALAAHEAEPKQEAPEAPRAVKVRQWIAIGLGVPALIFFLYFVTSRLYALS